MYQIHNHIKCIHEVMIFQSYGGCLHIKFYKSDMSAFEVKVCIYWDGVISNVKDVRRVFIKSCFLLQSCFC